MLVKTLGYYGVFQIEKWVKLLKIKKTYEISNYFRKFLIEHEKHFIIQDIENDSLNFNEIDFKIQENKKMLDDVNKIIINLKDIEIVENYFFNIPDNNIKWLIFHDFFSL